MIEKDTYNTDAKKAISGSTGVSYNNSTGQISIGQAVGTTDIVTFKQVNADSSTLSTLRLNGDNKKILIGGDTELEIYHD